MIYFAYGSNLCPEQMKERCPSVRFVARATLPGHRFAISRKSKNRGCGVADAVRHDGKDLWGVVYVISDADVGGLDKSEGFGENSAVKNICYFRRPCLILLDGLSKHPLTVMSYFARAESNPPPPNREYMDIILSGARHWQLPNEHIRELERVDVAG